MPRFVAPCLLLISALTPGLALAGPVPFSDTVWYPCGPEEAVSLEGTFMRRVWSTTDGNGVRHRHIVYGTQGLDGIGMTTGQRYVAGTQEHSTQQFEFVDDGQIIDVHTVLTQRLDPVGRGQVAMLFFSVDAQYSSASEDPISERLRFWSECRGQ